MIVGGSYDFASGDFGLRLGAGSSNANLYFYANFSVEYFEWLPPVPMDIWERGAGNPDSPEGQYIHAVEHGNAQEVAAAALKLPIPGISGNAVIMAAAGYGFGAATEDSISQDENSLDIAIDISTGWARHSPGGPGDGGGGRGRDRDRDRNDDPPGGSGGERITGAGDLSGDAGITTGDFTPPPGTWSDGGDHGTPDPGLPVNPDYVGIQPVILDLDGDGVEIAMNAQIGFGRGGLVVAGSVPANRSGRPIARAA